MKQFCERIILLSLVLVQVLSSSESQNLKIEWVTKELLEIKPIIKFSESLRWSTERLNCRWYKLSENLHLLSGKDSLYNSTNTADDECNLEIKFENTYQIDYYLLNIYGSKLGISYADREPVYALFYVDSFKIVKKQKTESDYTYSCQVDVMMPSSEIDDELNEHTEELLKRQLVLNHGIRNKNETNEYTSIEVVTPHAKRRQLNEVSINKKRISISQDFNIKNDADKSLICHLMLLDNLDNSVYRKQIFANFADYEKVEFYKNFDEKNSAIKLYRKFYITLILGIILNV